MADELTLDEKIKQLINNLKQGNLSGSYIVARNTLQVLRDIIIQDEWTNIQDLMNIIRTTSHELIQAQLSETCVRNMVQRVLKIIREEHAGQEGDHQESLQKLLLAEGATSAEKKSDMSSQTLKEAVLDSIGELLTELESSAFNIAAQASHYIHTNEVIMTTGKSRTVQAFLKKAAKKIKFQVIVVERAPFYDGQEMALSLAKDGIKTTVITDSAVFAVMARVNKVIIGTHTVMANGGLKAVSGSHAVALAAKYYSIPLIVCAAMFKLSPQYLCSYDQDAFNKFVSPHNVLQFSEGLIDLRPTVVKLFAVICCEQTYGPPGELLSKVQVYNPVFDYVPPELVTSFISNVGGHAPSYVYRLLNELYHPDDFDL